MCTFQNVHDPPPFRVPALIGCSSCVPATNTKAVGIAAGWSTTHKPCTLAAARTQRFQDSALRWIHGASSRADESGTLAPCASHDAQWLVLLLAPSSVRCAVYSSNTHRTCNAPVDSLAWQEPAWSPLVVAEFRRLARMRILFVTLDATCSRHPSWFQRWRLRLSLTLARGIVQCFLSTIGCVAEARPRALAQRSLSAAVYLVCIQRIFCCLGAVHVSPIMSSCAPTETRSTGVGRRFSVSTGFHVYAGVGTFQIPFAIPQRPFALSGGFGSPQHTVRLLVVTSTLYAASSTSSST